MSDEYEHEDDSFLDNPLFEAGMKVGGALGAQRAYKEAQRAYDMGEIELWLNFNRPKTVEEWSEFYKTHDREVLRVRWKSTEE